MNDASFAHVVLLTPYGPTVMFFCFLQVVLNKVLLLGSQTQTIIGRPILPDAAVHAVVEEHVRESILYFFSCMILASMMIEYLWHSYKIRATLADINLYLLNFV